MATCPHPTWLVVVELRRSAKTSRFAVVFKSMKAAKASRVSAAYLGFTDSWGRNDQNIPRKIRAWTSTYRFDVNCCPFGKWTVRAWPMKFRTKTGGFDPDQNTSQLRSNILFDTNVQEICEQWLIIMCGCILWYEPMVVMTTILMILDWLILANNI